MGTDITRRGFAGGALALSAAGVFRMAHGEAGRTGAFGKERLRFGVLSDIHLLDRTPQEKRRQEKIARALRRFDEWKADAVMCCGDIADYGLGEQLKIAGEVWKSVFPNGKGSDGREVVNLFHYGDHDMSVFYVDRPAAVALIPDPEKRKSDLIFTGDRGRIWKAAFGESEPWAPIVLKVVKGYPFVLSHFTRGEEGNKHGNNVPGLAAFLKANAAKFDPSKPLFYSQHRIPRNTACGRETYGQDDGTVGRILSGYPNAVAFCGHAHMNASNDRSIWQGGFTCIQVPGHRYCTTEAGRQNGYALADKRAKGPAQTMRPCPASSAGQAMFCRVYDSAIVVERWEISPKTANSMGEDWVVPFASFAMPPETRPFNHARRAKSMPGPVFPDGASVEVTEVKDKDRKGVMTEFLEVTFPAAGRHKGHPRANDYDIALEEKKAGKVRELNRLRFYPHLYHYGEAADSGKVAGRFRKSDVPSGGMCRFVVRPVNGMGGMGDPIATDWTKFS